MTPVLVCEAVRAASMDALVRARDASKGADLVELRLDGVSDADAAGALAGRRQPVVVTCRPRWGGGQFDGDEDTRKRILDTAACSGAEFVDVEWQAPWRDAFLARWADRAVLSWHDFAGVPSDLASRVSAMAATGAAVVKVAVAIERLEDLEPLMGLHRSLPPGRKLVAIGMGEAGVVTRILPKRFGSCWTYAGNGVAPGQVPVDSLIREFRVRSISNATALYGLVGRPVTRSVFPAMHNAAFAQLRLDAVYVPFAAASFDDFVWAARAFDVAGATISGPFKEEAFRVAAGADVSATAGGAANTLRKEASGAWAARNIDGGGFPTPLADTQLSGIPAVDGFEMAVAEAAAQFEWWTGARAPIDVMRAAGRRRLEEFRQQDAGYTSEP